MSLRALRKLNKGSLQDDLVKYASPSPDPEESSEEEAPTRSKKVNAFAFLEEEEEEEDDDDVETETAINGNPEPLQQPQKEEEEEEEEIKPVSVPVKLQSKKSKKKSKKAKGKKSSKQVPEAKAVDSDEELDRILKELEIKENRIITTNDFEAIAGTQDIVDKDHVEMIDDSFAYFTINKLNQSLKFLKVQPKDLDPDTEFKNLFGSDLSSLAIEDADSTSSSFVSPEILAQIKKMSRMVRGWGGKDRRSVPGTTRKLTFTKIRDDWIPTQQKSVGMKELGKNELLELFTSKTDDWKDVITADIANEQKLGVRYYKFTQNIDSKVDNARFFISVVLTPDHESLIALLHKNPYHVETILQVSTILFRQGDKSNSNGLIERALFVFDRALKQNFEIGNGLMRLPFEYFLNRQFYLSMFRYLELLTQRSTFYTALQYCIFMLSLNPTEDPYGVRYFIDFYAIMAGEYEYLINFTESPLSTTYLEWLTPALVYSKVLALLLSDFDKNLEKAKADLETAFKLHPYTGYKLLELVGLSGGSTRESLFDDVSVSDIVAAESYMIRAKVMWGEDPKIRNFVNSELSKLIVNNAPAAGKNSVSSFFTSFFGRGTSKTEQEIPVNLMRHIILSGESKVMAKLPASFWDLNKDKILEYDVLPPENDMTESFGDWVDDDMVSNSLAFRSEDEAMMEAIRQTMRDEMERQAEGGAAEHD